MKPHFTFINIDLEPYDHSRPEKRLMLSLISSAILDAIGDGAWLGNNNSSDRKRNRARALNWITSDDVYCDNRKGVSFLFACEHVDLCPNHIRQGVFNRTLRKVPEAA